MPKARKNKNLVEEPANMEDNGNKAIAALIKNTRTTNRHISLIEMTKWIDARKRGFTKSKAISSIVHEEID